MHYPATGGLYQASRCRVFHRTGNGLATAANLLLMRPRILVISMCLRAEGFLGELDESVRQFDCTD